MEDSVHLALCIPENKPGFMEKHIEEKKKKCSSTPTKRLRHDDNYCRQNECIKFNGDSGKFTCLLKIEVTIL